MSAAGYVVALALVATVLPRLREPRLALGDPLNRSTCVAILLNALVLISSAPGTIAAVDEVTGVANLGAVLTYAMLSALSCALLVLLVHWRGGPGEEVRRIARRCVVAYGLVVATLIGLFASAHTPVERVGDLDTYYATTPGMREMILLYLVGHTVAEAALLVWCRSWQREVRGVLRTGLRLIMAGCVLDLLGFLAPKYLAILARWHGHDLDALSTLLAPPLAALAALTTTAGFVLPRLGPSVCACAAALRDHRRLAPLWAEVRSVETGPKPRVSWWHPPQERLQHREVSIHDALLALAPYFDDELRGAAHTAALAGRHAPHDARLIAEAAMVTDAVRRAADRAHPGVTASAYRLYATEEPGPHGLVALSRALVPAARLTARPAACSPVATGSPTTPVPPPAAPPPPAAHRPPGRRA